MNKNEPVHNPITGEPNADAALLLSTEHATAMFRHRLRENVPAIASALRQACALPHGSFAATR